MKAILYWQLSDRTYFFSLDELDLSYNPTGIEKEGVYEISHPDIELCEKEGFLSCYDGDGNYFTTEIDGKMLYYKGDGALHDLYTTQGKNIRPFIEIYVPELKKDVRLFLKKRKC